MKISGKKAFFFAAVLTWCLLLASLPAYAAENAKARISEIKSKEDCLLVFVRGGGSAREGSALLGKIRSESVQVQTMQEAGLGMRTLILIDNSLSIPDESREKIQKELLDFVAARETNEFFALGTISDHVEILQDYTADYPAFKTSLENLKYQYQDTFLTDALYDYLIEEPFAESNESYDRILVISDGVDNKSIGYTKDELLTLLKAAPIPIYSMGITNWNENNNEELENMFALSRATGGESVLIDDLKDQTSIATLMAGDRDNLTVTVQIPEAAQDGSLQTLTIQLNGGETVSIDQVRMPLLEEEPVVPTPPKPEPEPVVEPDPEPESDLEPGPEKNSLEALPLIAAAVAAAVAVVVLAMLLLKRKNAGKPKNESTPSPQPAEEGALSDDDATVIVPEVDEDRAEVGEDDHGGTEGLWDEEPVFHITLTDINFPERFYQKAIKTSLIIGFSRDSDICIDYDKSVSRKHCEIIREGTDFYLINHSKNNGTYLDRVRVEVKMPLSSGSIIKMGRVEVEVNISN